MITHYWEYLNGINREQLKDSGYENFKRTVALNYFTWVIPPWSDQSLRLIRKLPIDVTGMNLLRAILIGKHKPWSLFRSWSYNFLTLQLWCYMEMTVPIAVWGGFGGTGRRQSTEGLLAWEIDFSRPGKFDFGSVGHGRFADQIEKCD